MTLLAHIRSLIEKSGPMSLARYMELALQHPEWGYYKKGDPLGAEGDFITAPEISQMFGELTGLCLAEAWKNSGKPDPFILCELGPGRGTLLQDALRATAKIPGFHHAMDLCLIESNQTLRAQQEEKLAGHHPRYLDNLASLPAHPLFLIANEFFDALPVRQFERTFDGWCERLVTAAGEGLAFVLSPPDPAFMLFIPQDMREALIGTVHEASLPALALTRQIAQHVTKHGGAALIVDYGYTAPPGKGTLQAASQHHHADVLENPGDADLTAHVDFAALKRVAEAQGWSSSSPLVGEVRRGGGPEGQFSEGESSAQRRSPHPNPPHEGEGIPAVHAAPLVLGPITQGEFLQTLGIEMRALQLKHNATPEQAKAVDDAVHRLTDVSEMGALFKVMAIVSPQLIEMAGF